MQSTNQRTSESKTLKASPAFLKPVITNYVFITSESPLPVSAIPWDTQVHYFTSGLQYGLGAALALAVAWGIFKAIRGGGWSYKSD